MSTSILTNFQFNQNQLLQPVAHNANAAPSSPVDGQFYFDTVKLQLGVYCGSTASWVYLSVAGTGSVTSASVVSANGFSGSVATSTTTPAITLSTSVSGLLMGSSGALVAATAGTDYLAPAGNGSALTGLTVGQVSGAAPTASPTFTGTVSGISVGMVAGAAPTASPTFTGTVSGISVGMISGAAPTASPTFTGTPAAPTPTAGTNTTQLATTAFVSSAVSAASSGLDPKPSVDALASANITLSGTQTIDGVALTAGMRVLAKAQTTASQNGLWVVASGAWTRPADFATTSVQNGAFVLVQAGTAFSGSGWVLSGTGSVTVDTTSETWVQFVSAQQLTAGTGITISSNTVSINSSATLSNNTTGTAANVTGTVAIANGGTGQTSAQSAINALAGSVTSGSFLRGNGTNVVMAALQAADVPTNAGAAPSSTKYAAVFTSANGNPNSTSWAVTHNLNNSNPVVDVYVGGDQVICDVVVNSANQITLGFAVAPTANTVSVSVVG
jgi:hypothetical protein